MPRQLAFDLPARPALGRGDFFVSDANAHAVSMIDAMEAWPGGKLVLTGPEGAGKTHLVHAFARAAGARFLSPSDDPSTIATPVVIDDAEAWTDAAEQTLFHVHNLAAERKLPLLLTARHAPAQWPIHLPDLKSRMAAITTVAITAPDDALLSAVLAKLFADRQVVPPPALLTYVVPRIERSFAAAQDFVARLDAAALAEGRAPTRALAARLLNHEEDV